MAGAALIVVGIGWLLHVSGLVDIPLSSLAPLGLIVIGIGLVVGSRRGSYPGLIVAGVVLTIFASATSHNDASSFGGERFEQPTDFSEVRPYRLGAGTLRVDLTLLPPDSHYDIDARVGAGRVEVVVPSYIPVRVEARSGVGRVDLFGLSSSGFGVKRSHESPDYSDSGARIDLHVRAGVGSVSVIGRSVTRPLDPPAPDPPAVPATPFEFPFDNDEGRF